MASNRFSDQHVRHSDFTDQVLVCCPSCSKKALVNDSGGIARLVCGQCGYLKVEYKTRYILSFKKNCNHCSHALEVYDNNLTQEVTELTIKCPACRKKETYPVKCTPYTISGGRRDGGKEFFFNADLWLKLPFKNEIFWAYNYRHLNYLKEYIQADLRENRDREFMSMTEKLPKFMQVAKNREALLKIIEKLQQKI